MAGTTALRQAGAGQTGRFKRARKHAEALRIEIAGGDVDRWRVREMTGQRVECLGQSSREGIAGAIVDEVGALGSWLGAFIEPRQCDVVERVLRFTQCRGDPGKSARGAEHREEHDHIGAQLIDDAEIGEDEFSYVAPTQLRYDAT